MYDLDFNFKGQLKLHIRKFLLFPGFWENAENQIELDLDWQHFEFTPENVNRIPDEHGIYCFVVKPFVSNFFETSYLFYIGETGRTLKIRYGEYLNDQLGKGKPRAKIFEMLNLYKDYLHFYCAVIDDKDEVEKNEDKLINSFVPAINTQIPNAKIKPEIQYIYE